jgi:hypothetical protein
MHVTAAHVLTSIGLILDIVGAAVLAWGLFIKEDDALKLSAVSGQSYSADHPTSRADMLKQPAVQDRLRQSKRAKWGIFGLTLGFVFQFLGTWCPT